MKYSLNYPGNTKFITYDIRSVSFLPVNVSALSWWWRKGIVIFRIITGRMPLPSVIFVIYSTKISNKSLALGNVYLKGYIIIIYRGRSSRDRFWLPRNYKSLLNCKILLQNILSSSNFWRCEQWRICNDVMGLILSECRCSHYMHVSVCFIY